MKELLNHLAGLLDQDRKWRWDRGRGWRTTTGVGRFERHRFLRFPHSCLGSRLERADGFDPRIRLIAQTEHLVVCLRSVEISGVTCMTDRIQFRFVHRLQFLLDTSHQIRHGRTRLADVSRSSFRRGPRVVDVGEDLGSGGKGGTGGRDDSGGLSRAFTDVEYRSGGLSRRSARLGRGSDCLSRGSARLSSISRTAPGQRST